MPQGADTGRPAYTSLNRLLVLIILSLSASLRFVGALNVDITSPSRILRPVDEPYGTVVCVHRRWSHRGAASRYVRPSNCTAVEEPYSTVWCVRSLLERTDMTLMYDSEALTTEAAGS